MKALLSFLSISALALAAEPAPHEFQGAIERLDPALDALLAPDAKVEKVAEGFTWSEGPTWYKGALIFSDPPENVIYRWADGMQKAEVFIKPSGMTVPTEGFREPGSNGLTTDAKGNLVLCQHGDRRIARWEDGKFITVADRFEGKKLNSPNDLVIAKNGDVYFTDPPYGFVNTDQSPLKEQPHHGVYRVTPGGKVSLVTKDINWPNGIALSPDEKTLYVGVSDGERPRVEAAEMQPDGTVAHWRVFFEAKGVGHPGEKGTCDGMKVDAQGNVWTTGPGGVLVLSPQGKLLGRILTGEPTANCGWGDDGSTLYICAGKFLARIKTKTKGAPWKE